MIRTFFFRKSEHLCEMQGICHEGQNLSESFMLRYKVGIDKTFGSKEYTKEMKKENPIFIKRVNDRGW